MSFFKDLFKKKEAAISTNAEFWDWFAANADAFFNVIKQKGDIEKDFFDHLSAKLNQLKDGYYYLTGMFDDDTAELVLTADGDIKNMVFVEELVAAAPQINGWRLTALKPPLDIENVSIDMAGYRFERANLSFYANEDPHMPDEINITVVHNDYTDDNKKAITNGTYIFLDNFLGELNFATTIDNINVTGKTAATKELVPIEKLKDFLTWRQKEFIEKYEGIRHNTGNDNYAILEAKFKNGDPLLAVINQELLQWDSKASHPWILNVEIKYDGKNNNGMPNGGTLQLLNAIEDDIMARLKDADGYLNIGRQTGDNVRDIYFACKDFREPAKALSAIEVQYKAQITIDHQIYKDKYWKTFKRFE